MRWSRAALLGAAMVLTSTIALPSLAASPTPPAPTNVRVSMPTQAAIRIHADVCAGCAQRVAFTWGAHATYPTSYAKAAHHAFTEINIARHGHPDRTTYWLSVFASSDNKYSQAVHEKIYVPEYVDGILPSAVGPYLPTKTSFGIGIAPVVNSRELAGISVYFADVTSGPSATLEDPSTSAAPPAGLKPYATFSKVPSGRIVFRHLTPRHTYEYRIYGRDRFGNYRSNPGQLYGLVVHGSYVTGAGLGVRRSTNVLTTHLVAQPDGTVHLISTTTDANGGRAVLTYRTHRSGGSWKTSATVRPSTLQSVYATATSLDGRHVYGIRCPRRACARIWFQADADDFGTLTVTKIDKAGFGVNDPVLVSVPGGVMVSGYDTSGIAVLSGRPRGTATVSAALPDSAQYRTSQLTRDPLTGTVYLIGRKLYQGALTVRVWALPAGGSWTELGDLPVDSRFTEPSDDPDQKNFALTAAAGGGELHVGVRVTTGLGAPSYDYTTQLFVFTRSVSGQWAVPAQLADANAGGRFALASSPTGAVVAAYTEDDQSCLACGGITTQSYANGTWSSPTMRTDWSNDTLFALAVDADGTPVIGYTR